LCVCEKEFDYHNAVQLTNTNYQQLKMDSINRLTDVVGKRCLCCKAVCRKTALNEKETKVASDEYYIVMVEPYTIEGVKLKDLHLLCKKCRETLKNEYDDVGEDNKKIKYIEIYCCLCNMTHQIDKSKMKDILKDKFCSCSCSIF